MACKGLDGVPADGGIGIVQHVERKMEVGTGPFLALPDYANRFGTDDETQEGFFDLSGVPLPTGQTAASYQLSFEAIDPLYIGSESVGSYTTGQVTPSGTYTVLVTAKQVGSQTITQNPFITYGNGNQMSLPFTMQVTIPPGTPSGSYAGIQLASAANQSLTNYTLWSAAVIVK